MNDEVRREDEQTPSAISTSRTRYGLVGTPDESTTKKKKAPSLRDELMAAQATGSVSKN